VSEGKVNGERRKHIYSLLTIPYSLTRSG